MTQKLFNQYEELTYKKLLKVTDDWGAHVFAKVRIADILPITKSGIPDVEFKFALQSHFDFLVANEKYLPLFAIEFDGSFHSNPKQIIRDL